MLYIRNDATPKGLRHVRLDAKIPALLEGYSTSNEFAFLVDPVDGHHYIVNRERISLDQEVL